MFLLMIALLFLIDLFSKSSALNLPPDCQFLNPIHDSSAETALLELYYDSNNNKSFIFKEVDFFQPQCLLCKTRSSQLCFGYKGGASYGIPSGTIQTVQLITNLPYIYLPGENIGSLITVINAIFTLREDLVIPYRTLLRFKGTLTQAPVVYDKLFRLRLCMICMPGDTSEHSLLITGTPTSLSMDLFINEMLPGGKNAISFSKNQRVRINCENRKVTFELQDIFPNQALCSRGSCLGTEYCLTYQPEYSTTRETWCPLTENNWISTPKNALKLSPSDSSLPLNIQLERILLQEKPFSLVLNPNWFIEYVGVVTLSVPEATFSNYSDSIWKIVLPSVGQRPLNQRIILLHNCTDVRIRYHVVDSEYYQITIVFVDMKSNSTFTVKDNLEEAKQLCNPDILIAINDTITTTSRPQIQTTTSNGRTIDTVKTNSTQTPTTTPINGHIDGSTRLEPSGYKQLIQPSFVIIILFYMFLFTV